MAFSLLWKTQPGLGQEQSRQPGLKSHLLSALIGLCPLYQVGWCLCTQTETTSDPRVMQAAPGRAVCPRVGKYQVSQFSRSLVSNSLQPHELQHARLSCPSPTARAYSNSCWSSQWCHPTISSSVVPLSSCLQSFLASGSFPMSQLFASGGQSIRASTSALVLPINIQDWFPLGWTGWISLQSKGLSRVFSNMTVQKHQVFGVQLSLQSNCHIHTWLL